MYTTATLFLRTLADCGITHAFVNWGSDHPALLEELERERAEEGQTAVEVLTCPSEMAALSAAQGYGQASRKPAAVIVHTDVGTQALAGAVHNADKSRTPVLIFAGACPSVVDQNGVRGARNEWSMYTQDVHDQPAIVRQYMRFTAQIDTPKNTSQLIRRALQICTSEPQGPVYLWARREVMEAEIEEPAPSSPISMHRWPPIEPPALSESVAKRVAQALSSAQSPLIITSHLGRNPAAVDSLLALSILLALPIVATCPTVVNTPFSHPYFCKLTYLAPGTHCPLIRRADVILVLDADIAWIPATHEVPSALARVFVLNSADPLNTNVGYWHLDAELVAKADAATALEQIFAEVRALDSVARTVGKPILRTKAVLDRGKRKAKMHGDYVAALDAEEARAGGALSVANVLGALRGALEGKRALVLNEGVSNYTAVWEHLRPEVPGSHFTSGGSSLGWALGAAVGVHLGKTIAAVSGDEEARFDIVVAVVGDGAFMFGAPSASYWMARRYDTPYLTVILNNGGWKSPKLSMLGVYPDGYGSRTPSAERLSTGFGPDYPDYSQIAIAASGNSAWGRRVGGETSIQDMKDLLSEAVKVVIDEGRSAVLDVQIESA
ncbi:thiamine pyrophosphate enzyme, N-terminal TPP binding domain-containing protein [Schizophyllum fasciatum]